MKAVAYQHYGPPEVLQLKLVPQPQAKENQILVKVFATTVNRTDNATVKGIPFFARIVTGLFRPKQTIPGSEFSGEVISVGSAVQRFKPGDRVFGFIDLGSGAQAQYLAIDERYARLIPANISYAQAAASIEGAHYAYSGIKRAQLKQGQSAMVYGASGAIGSAAVQILKYFGLRVTAVCGTRHIELLKQLGADKVVDYQRQDFTRDDEKYDFILDAVGKTSFFKCNRLLNRGGIYISSDLGFLGQNIFLPFITLMILPLTGFRKTMFPIPHAIPVSLDLIEDLLAQKQFNAVIDRHYALEDIVEAYRYVEKGQKTGNVVIDITHDDKPTQNDIT